jgi:hypothetical protein
MYFKGDPSWTESASRNPKTFGVNSLGQHAVPAKVRSLRPLRPEGVAERATQHARRGRAVGKFGDEGRTRHIGVAWGVNGNGIPESPPPPLSQCTRGLERIQFRAARFRGEEVVEKPRVTVIYNGVKIHDDVELKVFATPNNKFNEYARTVRFCCRTITRQCVFGISG